MTLPRFEYLSPKTLAEACAMLAEHREKARLLAGGTDLLIKMERGTIAPGFVVALRRVPDLDHVRFDPKSGLVFGARAVLSAIAEHPAVAANYASLAESAVTLATVQIRNMATVVGNICNASPCANTATPLLVHGAQIVAVRLDGGRVAERTLSIDDFFLGPSKKALEPTEILTEVRLPPPKPRTGSRHERISQRSHVDIAAVSASACLTLDEAGRCTTARVAIGAVAPVPLRVRDAETVLEGKVIDEAAMKEAALIAMRASRPIDDVRSSAAWRRKMVEVLTLRALRHALSRARGEGRVQP